MKRGVSDLKLTGAKILIECLRKEDVEVIFGFPGGAVLPVFDVLYDSPMRFVLMRHEQAAAHAADGYARATGRVGVCIATSGPGATNLVTGIATANMDSVPLVALTGQVPTSMIGNDAFQEADIVGITRPITKHSYLVRDVRDLARTIKEALHIASTGRPGPVLIDLPKDVQQDVTEFEYPVEADIRSYKPTYVGHYGQIRKAAELMAASERPVIYAGGGVIISGANHELRELAEITQIPVATTLLGLGGFPEVHQLSLGMLGMHGTRYANYAIMESDLIVAVAARFDDRVTGKLDQFAPHAKIIHIDIDPAAISKNVVVHVPIVGDVKTVLTELNKQVTPGNHKDWLDKIKAWKETYPLAYDKSGGLRPEYVVEMIYETTKGEAIITTEVGQNQMWAAHFYKYMQPRTFISSGGLGTMGYGFPAAIGAQIGRPDKLVFDIAGDGSIQMNIQELATISANNIPVKIAILNNGYLGMVRQWQELFFDKRYSYTCLTRNASCPQKCQGYGGGNAKDSCVKFMPDFIRLAKAYDILGIKVDSSDEVKPALEEAIDANRPVVIDFRVVREENVFPMVPAGATLTEMIGGMA